MIVGREELIFFEELAKKQKRIYPNATDVGVIVNKELKEQIRKNVERLKNYGSTNIEVINSWGDPKINYFYGKSIRVFIPVEPSDYHPGEYDGFILKLIYNVSKPKKLEILTIEGEHSHFKMNW